MEACERARSLFEAPNDIIDLSAVTNYNRKQVGFQSSDHVATKIQYHPIRPPTLPPRPLHLANK